MNAHDQTYTGYHFNEPQCALYKARRRWLSGATFELEQLQRNTDEPACGLLLT